MLVNDVIARIEGNVPALVHRVQGAAELSALVKTGNAPQETPAAFVLPLGLRGGEADAAAGVFRQNIDEVVAVVLFVEAAGDVTGETALPTIDALINAVRDALCGWAPGDEVGVFQLRAGNLVSLSAGSVIYQLNFTIQDQLRITA